ncbi:Flp family type IVb pilin [Heliomicrobium gestii]|nr:Flp family type IVb pilin [Heliomicrobium gestii]MBM7866202.1 pilus assembly protein Flp/PilA [Heliomicrobium gestii]
MREWITNNMQLLIDDEDGQGLVEYGLILALVVIVCIALLRGIGTSMTNKLNQVNNALS